MKKEKGSARLGGVRPDSIKDVRPSNMQSGIKGKMEWKSGKGKTTSRSESRSSNAY